METTSSPILIEMNLAGTFVVVGENTCIPSATPFMKYLDANDLAPTDSIRIFVPSLRKALWDKREHLSEIENDFISFSLDQEYPSLTYNKSADDFQLTGELYWCDTVSITVQTYLTNLHDRTPILSRIIPSSIIIKLLFVDHDFYDKGRDRVLI